MKKLNNEELQNVSAGTVSDLPAGVPTLEDATALLLQQGGKCKCAYCGMPVQEFVPLGVDEYPAYDKYFYFFKCNCNRPLVAVIYQSGSLQVVPSAITPWLT